jgi:hypothetical protein
MTVFRTFGVSVSSGCGLAASMLLAVCGSAQAGGTPENALIIANPASQ